IADLFARPHSPDLASCFLNLLGDTWAASNPEILLCGEVQPKIFGIPVSQSLAAVAGRANKTNLIFVESYSPSATLAMPLLMLTESGTGLGGLGTSAAVGLLATSLFVQDQAQGGFNLDWPDPGQALLGGLAGRFNSPDSISN